MRGLVDDALSESDLLLQFPHLMLSGRVAGMQCAASIGENVDGFFHRGTDDPVDFGRHLVHGSAAILRTPAESMRDLADDLARCLAAVPKSRASSQPRSLDLANYSSESAHGMGA